MFADYRQYSTTLLVIGKPEQIVARFYAFTVAGTFVVG
jgi:hypothetical protein